MMLSNCFCFARLFFSNWYNKAEQIYLVLLHRSKSFSLS